MVLQLRYNRVCVEAWAYTLPEEIVSTDQIESRLSPLYDRLKLPLGRLELMTGIRERRFFPIEERPSRISAITGRKAIATASLAPASIGALIHGSVCRDCLEPATACAVHRQLNLPAACAVYDVSNACLGLLNGIVQAANMIELGHIKAAVVVGTENGRQLVESTIAALNADLSLDRKQIKTAFASLTIGAGSAAVVLVDRSLSRHGHRLLGGALLARTDHCDLCRGDHVAGSPEKSLLMETDSEALLREGIAAATIAFDGFLDALNWRREQINRTFCHQVGKAHHRLLFESLGLDATIDFATYPTLGNTGAVALPMTAARGIEQTPPRQGDRVALLGIGSGINVVMLGLDWGTAQ